MIFVVLFALTIEISKYCQPVLLIDKVLVRIKKLQADNYL